MSSNRARECRHNATLDSISPFQSTDKPPITDSVGQCHYLLSQPVVIPFSQPNEPVVQLIFPVRIESSRQYNEVWLEVGYRR